MAENIIIRPAVTADISGMVNILTELLKIENEIADTHLMTKGFELVMSNPDSYFISVAEMNGEIVGMCQAQALVSVDEGGLVAYIENVIVKDELRSCGLGAKLLTAVEDACQKAGIIRVFLLVLAKNKSGIKFYERNGWQQADHVYMDKEFNN